MATGLVMKRAAVTAAMLGGGLVLQAAAARADCAWDIRMATSDVAEVEATLPLAENPDLPLGPGIELPPQRRSTQAAEGAPGVGDGELVSGATPAGQEVVPDQKAMVGEASEGAVTPAADGGAGPRSGASPAADHVAGAKLALREAQAAANAGDETACFEKVDEAKELVSQARAAIITATGGTLPEPSGPPSDGVEASDAERPAAETLPGEGQAAPGDVPATPAAGADGPAAPDAAEAPTGEPTAAPGGQPGTNN